MAEELPALEIPGRILVRGYIPDHQWFYPRRIAELLTMYQPILDFFEIKKPNPLQERILFCLCHKKDLYVAAPKSSGKMTAYLIPVVALCAESIAKRLEQNPIPNKLAASPFTIIICESTQSGVKIKQLLDNKSERQWKEKAAIPIVTLLDNIQSEDIASSMENNPVDILIISGPAFQELLNYKNGKTLASFGLKYDRTRFIIFEELGMKNYFSHEDITNFFNQSVDKSTRTKILDALPFSCQLIFSGTTWDHEHIGSVRQHLFSKGRLSILIFGSSLNTFQYASTSIKWEFDHVTSEKAKLHNMIGLIKDLLMEKRNIVVACNHPDTAEHVSKYISENGDICNKLVTEGYKRTAGIFRRSSDWLGRVFIVSDDAWKDLDQKNISCLINFDIGGKSEEDTPNFCHERFACLWNRMFVMPKRNSSLDAAVLIFYLLSGDEPNFLHLYKFLKAANVKMIPNLMEIGEQKLANDVLSRQFCENLQCFAYCHTVGTDCPFRHEFIREDFDIPSVGPANGELGFKVIKSLNPSLYIVQLLSHYIFEEETGRRRLRKCYREEANQRFVELMDYYTIKRNRIRPTSFSIGELFAVPCIWENPRNSSKTTLYLRARMIKTESIPDHVEMFCVDSGKNISVPFAILLMLPEKFQKWEPHCIKVILTNMFYNGDQREYCSDALIAAGKLAEHQNWHAKVLLSIRDITWVNPMVQFEKDPITDHISLGKNLITELVGGNYTAFNNNHMSTLMEYIWKMDPNYPEIEHELNTTSIYENCLRDENQVYKLGDPVYWTELPLSKMLNENENDDVFIPIQFTIQSCLSPWEIYGSKSEHSVSAEVMRLEQELSSEIEKLGKKRMKCLKKFSSLLRLGSIVAVLSNKKRGWWRRAMVLEKYKFTEEIGHRFFVLFVDYGYTGGHLKEFEEVVPIRKMFVEALPFQAVRLQLSHIHPVEGLYKEWKDEEIEKLSDYFDKNKEVTVIAYRKTLEATNQSCNHYDGMIFQKLEENKTFEEIGVELVEKKCAEMSMPLERVVSIVSKVVSGLKVDDDDDVPPEIKGQTFAIADDDFEDDDDRKSDASMEIWERFGDVKDDGEYVAIKPEECYISFENEINFPTRNADNVNEGLEDVKDENVQSIFGTVCEKLNRSQITAEEVNMGNGNLVFGIYNGDDDDADDDSEDEFYDAEDYYGNGEILPEEACALAKDLKERLNSELL